MYAERPARTGPPGAFRVGERLGVNGWLFEVVRSEPRGCVLRVLDAPPDGRRWNLRVTVGQKLRIRGRVFEVFGASAQSIQVRPVAS